MRTGSKRAMAWATAAYSAVAASYCPCHNSGRVGHAIRQRSCGVHSAGVREEEVEASVRTPAEPKGAGSIGRSPPVRYEMSDSSMDPTET